MRTQWRTPEHDSRRRYELCWTFDAHGSSRRDDRGVGACRLQFQLEVEFRYVADCDHSSDGLRVERSLQSVNQFKTSLSTLANPSTFTGGKSGIQTALDSVKTSLNNVKTTLKSGDKPKVDALQSSITDLQKAINNMSGVSGLAGVASAAKNVGQSAQAVLAAAKAGCPSS